VPSQCSGGMALMKALQRRESRREFDGAALQPQQLSNLLWAASGINRPTLAGRSAPSAMNSQEVQLYVAMPQGQCRYESVGHLLQMKVTSDMRRVTRYQDSVDTAPLDLIYVADQHLLLCQTVGLPYTGASAATSR
jgi:hypothetical protein